MILKICPYCQTENPENANFCKKCGALFRGEPQIRDTIAERNKRNNKLIVSASVFLLVVALAVIMRGTGDKPEVSTTTTTTASTTESTTLPAVTVAPSANATTAPSTTLPTTTATTTTVTTTVAPIVSTDEICKEFNSLVGSVKGKTTDVAVHKIEKINLEITSFSLPVPTDAINSFMARLVPESDVTYNFANGIAKQDSKISLSSFIPPATKAVPEVTADNLLSAEKDIQGNITLKFKPDSSTFADGQTVFPLHVGAATDVLDFATFSLGPVKIVKADIQYPATEIRAEVDATGELTKLIITQPVSVTSTGGVGSMTADVGMNLKAVTTFEIR